MSARACGIAALGEAIGLASQAGVARGGEFIGELVAIYDRERGQTAAVASHSAGATPRGIDDMAGNLAEWTHSLFRPYPYDADDGREAPDAEGERVTRGGDYLFDTGPAALTTYFRDGFSRDPVRGHRHIGFRCAADGA